ncbi:hypothetical protein ACP70R_011051 [Stipagrostis hirtigluma subsp. patula]
MGKRRAGESEGQEAALPASAPDAKKTKRGAEDEAPGGGMCDDVVHNIFARLPARAAVASMALSKHHRRLIRSPEFGALHCRLAPPLPRPHVAYVATDAIKIRPGQEEPLSGYVGFHVAGGGLSGGDGNNAPMRALAGERYLDRRYVNTCNGVVLLASREYSAPCKCILWNPAVAGVVKEVTVPAEPAGSELLVLGLGYGRKSNAYKLLLCRAGAAHRFDHADCSLVMYELGDVEHQPQLQTVTPAELVREINEESIYIDGTIYLLDKKISAILALDVDEGTVTSIHMPLGPDGDPTPSLNVVSNLMELSGRPCLVTRYGSSKALWLLLVDHQWKRKCLIHNSRYCFVVGVWDCGGVLVLFSQNRLREPYRIYLYHLTSENMFKASLSLDLAPKLLDHEICWGYRPTLVSPRNIVGKFNHDKERQPTNIMKALKPITQQFTRKGRKATLNIVCVMDLLVRIMQKLPDEIQEVVETPKLDSEDPDLFFQNVVS